MRISIGEVDGDSWEELLHKLLKLRYQGKYTVVPARFGGDLGIESFSQDKVFQCYCPDGDPTATELYEGQRDKITSDIQKLIRNEVEIKKLVGNTKISTWFFVTPTYQNKKLIEHCQKKAMEIKAKNLSIINNASFRIQLLTESDFIVELNTLVNTGLAKFSKMPSEVDDDEIKKWQEDQSQFFLNLERKITQLLSDRNRVEKYITSNIVALIKSEALLDEIGNEFPDLYESIISFRNSWEEEVSQRSILGNGSNDELLKSTSEEFYNELKGEQINQLSIGTIRLLQRGAISFWLCNCPLEFN